MLRRRECRPSAWGMADFRPWSGLSGGVGEIGDVSAVNTRNSGQSLMLEDQRPCYHVPLPRPSWLRRLWQHLSKHAPTDSRTVSVTQDERCSAQTRYPCDIYHIPPNYVVEHVTTQRKPPEVRICRL